MVSATELKCKDRFGEDFGYGKSITWCYCHNDESTKTCTESSISEVSSEVKELRKANDENGNSIPNVYFWLKDAYDTDPNNENSCSAYSVNISHGYVCYRSRYEGAYALCE